MKRITLGIVAGGAGVAALLAAAAANADTSSWTPDYTVDNATLYAGPSLNSPAWELPASFSYGTGTDATTLTGTDYLMKSAGGLNDEFITKGGAIYDQNQLGGGYTNLYYDSGASGASPVDIMKTPFGQFNVSSLASWFAPPAFPVGTAEEVGHNFVIADFGGTYIQQALSLYNSDQTGWLGGPTDKDVITSMQTPGSSLVWSVPTSFTQGSGADATTLTGTEYVTSPTDVEFVTKSGDIFDQDQWSSGLVNAYYDPKGGIAQDFLYTDFGIFNLSSIASWFAPADVADLTTPSPDADLSDAGLYSALDLGLPSA